MEFKNTMPYTPQQNGFYERMNKTLMDKAGSVLSGVGITQELWVETFDTAKYLVNRYPSSVLVKSTSHEAWFGKNPFLSHLIFFWL
jgi:hypothetical protein